LPVAFPETSESRFFLLYPPFSGRILEQNKIMLQRAMDMLPIPGFLSRRAGEVCALLALAASVLLATALFTYHPADPSWNQAGGEGIQNAMGWPGAVLADLLWQSFGGMAILLAMAPLGWGWRWLQHDGGLRLGWRMAALMLVLISGTTLAALLTANGAGWFAPASGAIGILLGFWLVKLLTSAGAIALTALLFLASLPLALGLRWYEYVALFIILRQGMEAFARQMRTLARVVHQYLPRRDRGEDREAEEEESDDALAKEAPELTLLPKPKKRVEPKKPRAVAEQSSLELRAKKGDFTLPSLGLLQKAPAKSAKQQSESALEQNARLLETVLMDFGIKGEITKIRPGPVVTLYELEPAPGIKSSRVIGLADDIARSMSAISARIAVIPGRNAIGIELPNAHRETVWLRDLFEDKKYTDTATALPLVLGKDIGGEAIIADLAKMPHLLVAGTTGSGKSVAINTMIMSLVYYLTPEQCKFIMIDPKMLELSIYDDIPHLLCPVVTEPGKAVVALKWTVKEMENRYRLMSHLGVRNIDNYNKRLEEARRKGEELTRTVQTGFDAETGQPIMEKQPLDMSALPFIVVVVDEMADLMLVAGKEIETSIQRLAQMARAAGIHIIMATQRPSVDVITGVIKANFPTRISFQVTSKIDSRTILGEQGAEQLLGQGDMLYMAGGGRITRVHGPFISDKEVESIAEYLRSQGAPVYEESVTRDEEDAAADAENFGEGDMENEVYRQAVQIVLQEQKASTSYIQRRLKLGYNRAARLIDQMEKEGIVGPANHVGKREVLMR
jgi:S-DNA-T family DNA segregation ATPase FtsK/SpoIIIE